MTVSPETREKIRQTLKRKGIKPLQRYDPTGKKHSPMRYAKFIATLERKWPKAEIKCLCCRKKFLVPIARKDTAKFCSKECMVLYKRDIHIWVTPIKDRARRSIAYRVWREDVFKRDKYTCQWCWRIGGRLQADHIKKFADYPELRFDVSNGRTLCPPCHRMTPNYGNKGAVWISPSR